MNIVVKFIEDESGKYYHATVVELDGCQSTGDTEAEALEGLDEAIEGWIETKLECYMRLPYKIEIVEDKEEGGYALRCPELPGCITCAESIEEGLKMIEDAKRSWMTSCLERGDKIPKPS